MLNLHYLQKRKGMHFVTLDFFALACVCVRIEERGGMSRARAFPHTFERSSSFNERQSLSASV